MKLEIALRRRQFHEVPNHQDVVSLAAASMKILAGSSVEGREPAYPHNHGRNENFPRFPPGSGLPSSLSTSESFDIVCLGTRDIEVGSTPKSYLY